MCSFPKTHIVCRVRWRVDLPAWQAATLVQGMWWRSIVHSREAEKQVRGLQRREALNVQSKFLNV